MTPDNALVLIVVVGMFAVFMAVLAAVTVWTWLPEPKAGTAKAKAAAAIDHGQTAKAA